MTVKEALRVRFSAQPKKYYEVELFREKGFQRRRCVNCHRYFWTLDTMRTLCSDQTCQPYEFLGAPPTKKRLDYVGCWKEIESFFVRNGHTSVARYPVVCRWRPDLFFTVASVIDFQRIEGGKIVFEFPANPLIVPQMCLRFNDISNVGVTGKHFTSFCMLGQHSIANAEGYWKDRCIELDYRLLTARFGIKPKDVVFIEDVWVGYGAFGYSLEYFVKGLELGNAVFTAFEGTPENYREMKEKVIDMGAGLERFVWITQGTPTSYDCAFGPVMGKALEKCGIDYDKDFFLAYSMLAGRLNLDEVSDIMKTKAHVATELGVSIDVLNSKTEQLEALYAVADHARSLVFAIGDGGLPSNVGGGYNLRVILRRALGFIHRYNWSISLDEIANWHIDYLRKMYPELEEHRQDISTILKVEERRYQSSTQRAEKIAESLVRGGKSPSHEDLVRLYDSDGITPDFLKEKGLLNEVPPDFYGKVTARHMVQAHQEAKPRFEIEDIPATRLLFYEYQDLFEFKARVLGIFEKRFVVLDRTAFYARSGGQEPDFGTIGDCDVINVEKYGKVVLHESKGCNLKVGQTVRCRVNAERRAVLMRQHTATHILNGAARKLLGSWVWQHSAFKDVERSRLDITHYAHLGRDQILQLEKEANEIVRTNLPVLVQIIPRVEAEKKFGFRLYQGGVVPGRDVRIINIQNWDVEACGGTHCSSTGQVGFIKVLRAERVQDGVERIEFTAGEPAVAYAEKQEAVISSVSEMLGAQQTKLVEAVKNLKEEVEDLKGKHKVLMKKFSTVLAEESWQKALQVEGVKVFTSAEEGLDREYHITVGEHVIKAFPNLVYAAIIAEERRAGTIVFSGSEAQKLGVSADRLARELSRLLGGSGGGDARFAQGGGISLEKVDDVKRQIPLIISRMLTDK